MKEYKEYSNAAAVKAADIPQSVINDIADVFYNIFVRATAESRNKSDIKQTAFDTLQAS